MADVDYPDGPPNLREDWDDDEPATTADPDDEDPHTHEHNRYGRNLNRMGPDLAQARADIAALTDSQAMALAYAVAL